jgi:predicted benzoate:H+ symporter BenE
MCSPLFAFIMRAVPGKSSAVLLLVLLLSFVALAALPGGTGHVRVGPLSLVWWYGGVIAPVLAVTVAVLSRGARE